MAATPRPVRSVGSAFSWLLALRYLRSRWVNVIGVIGVMFAVWALIVVRGIFSGFIGDIRTEVRRSAPDLLVTSLPRETGYETLRQALADPDVVAGGTDLVPPASPGRRPGGL